MPHQNQKAAKTIQKFFLKNRYVSAYQAMRAEYGIDIVEQSKVNFQRLFQEIKSQPFSDGEFELWKTWQAKIVPMFTLKHATSKVEFDTLMPVSVRKNEGDTVNNARALGKGDALINFSYFTLGIGNDHPTPSFLGGSVETIVVRLGQLSVEQQRDFFGLWIGGHLQEYSTSETLDPIGFGSTRRMVSFDADTLTKTYRYEYADGKATVRRVHFMDEIFCADGNLATIFDALFYQFILELRFIGGDFQKYICENAQDPEIIKQVFHLLFPSWVYPEAKLPLKLSLQKPYVGVVKQPANFHELTSRWFKAAENGDVQALEECLNRGVPINALNDFHENALFVTAKSILLRSKASRKETIDFLLDKGIDINIRVGFGSSIMSFFIERDERELVAQFLKGIPLPTIPLVRRFSNLDKYRAFSLTALEKAVKHGRFEIAEDLLEHGVVITPEMPLIAYIYKNIRDVQEIQKWVLFFFNKGAAIDASLDGMTALMLASVQGNVEFVEFCLEHGADPNKAVTTLDETVNADEGRTALHLAAVAGHEDIVRKLVASGAKLEHQDYWGDTVYSIVCDQMASKMEDFVGKHEKEFAQIARSFQISTFFDRTVDSNPEQQAQKRQDMMINMFAEKTASLIKQWQSLQQKWAAIKIFLESQEVNQERLPKTPVQQCKKRRFAGAVFITYYIGNQPYVILVRNKNIHTGKPTGYFLAPGGVKGKNDDSLEATARREIFEEINLRITKDVQHCFSHSNVSGQKGSETYFEINFFHTQLPQPPKIAQLVAKSDVAEVCLVKWSDVVRKDGCYFYNGVRIRQSNAMLIDRLLQQQSFDDVLIREALQTESSIGHPLLAKMVDDEDLPSIRDLYNRGMDFGKTGALFYACVNNKSLVVELLLGLGVDVNIVGKEQNNFSILTPLMAAIQQQHFVLVKTLVGKYRANIDIFKKGKSALVCAVLANHRECVEYLLQQGASLGQGIGAGALLATVVVSNVEMAQMLLATKAIDLNKAGTVYASQSILGMVTEFPLWAAVRFGNKEFVELFLKYGADIWAHHDGLGLLDYIKMGLKTLEYDQTGRMGTYPPYEQLKAVAELLVDRFAQQPLSEPHRELLDEVGRLLEKAPPQYPVHRPGYAMQ